MTLGFAAITQTRSEHRINAKERIVANTSGYAVSEANQFRWTPLKITAKQIVHNMSFGITCPRVAGNVICVGAFVAVGFMRQELLF